MKFILIPIGTIFCLIGIVGLVLPVIPGIPFLLLGLSILAGYWAWARWLNIKIKKMFGWIPWFKK